MQDTYAFETHFKRRLERADFKRLVRETPLDVWICNTFRVLPTEERFKRLSEEQKYLLYVGFLEQPLPEQIHASYKASSVITIDKDTAKQLNKMGYSPDQLGRIKDQLKKAGMS